MDFKRLEEKLRAYFNSMNVEINVEIKDNDGLLCLESESQVGLVSLDDEEIQIKCLCYMNGTSQITFNFGEAYIDIDLNKLFEEYNQSIFSLKACGEFSEIRFYNQCFTLDEDGFLYNLDMVLTMFLKENSIDLIRPMLGYIKRS